MKKENGIYRMDTSSWSVERAAFLVAGVFVAVAASLSIYVDPRFVFADLFFGMMLVIFGVTGYCPMAMLLHRLIGSGKER